jgi:hypothetical protein
MWRVVVEVGSGCCVVYVDDLRWGAVVDLFMLVELLTIAV